MPWSAPQGTEAPGHFSRRGFQGESALKARPPVDWLIRLASRNSATRSCGDLSWPRSETVDRADDFMLRIKQDRKSTRLNSSHSQISYAVFCLKKKKKTKKH